MTFESKIKELNITLPKAADPVGSYVATKITGKMLFISGQISMSDKAELIKSVRRAIRTHKDDGSVSVEVLADIIISRAKYYVSKDEEFRAKLIS